MLATLRNGFRPRVALPLWAVALTLLVAVAAGVAVVLMVFLPDAVVPDAPNDADRHRLAAEAAIRATILQSAAGLVVLVGLGFTARSVHVSRETHLTDRLTKAVDQLGDAKPEVRLGGVYSLQRLADNSPVDRGMIASVLAGYLRVNATEPPANGLPIGPDVQTALTVLIGLRT